MWALALFESFPLFHMWIYSFRSADVSTQSPVYSHPKTHVHRSPPTPPQTHINPELKELKEITELTMFHKISVQDILYEWTPRRPPPTALPVSHLILFLRLLFRNDKWWRLWKQPARGVQETDREAPPSVHPREDLWQVKLINMMEAQVKPGGDITEIDPQWKLIQVVVYKQLCLWSARCKQEISKCQTANTETS